MNPAMSGVTVIAGSDAKQARASGDSHDGEECVVVEIRATVDDASDGQRICQYSLHEAAERRLRVPTFEHERAANGALSRPRFDDRYGIGAYGVGQDAQLHQV